MTNRIEEEEEEEEEEKSSPTRGAVRYRRIQVSKQLRDTLHE